AQGRASPEWVNCSTNPQPGGFSAPRDCPMLRDSWSQDGGAVTPLEALSGGLHRRDHATRPLFEPAHTAQPSFTLAIGLFHVQRAGVRAEVEGR
ncbi:MAG: hypothetical protein ACREA0_26730, partial [bacterium]